MRIINVVESQSGSITHLTSFCVHEDQLSQDVVDGAEKFFKDVLSSKTKIDVEDMDEYIEDGYYEDKDTGYMISILWSDVVE